MRRLVTLSRLLFAATILLIATYVSASEHCYTTSGSNAVYVGDFNNDGKADLAVLDPTTNSVDVLLGNGDGTFGTANGFSVGGSYPYRAVVGDFNGDKNLDIVTINLFTQNLSILLGNGNGTFQAASNFTAGNLQSDVVAGDFNHDNKLDLAVTDQSSTTIYVLLGNGDGTFQTPQGYATEQGPVAMTAGDFNHDGKLDLVSVSATTSDVSLLLGKGDGTFQAPRNFGQGSVNPVFAVAGDLNNDKKLDLVVVNSTQNVTVFLNGASQGKLYNVGGSSDLLNGAALADFNGDGNLDLAVADGGDQNGKGNHLALTAGNGTGGFRGLAGYPTGPFTLSVATGEFTSGKLPDVAVANGVGVCVLLNPKNPAR